MTPKPTVVPTPTPICIINVVSPKAGDIWAPGATKIIAWASVGQVGRWVNISLYKNGVLNRIIAVRAKNDGIFKWHIPILIPPSTIYRIRVTSVARPACNGESAEFAISSFVITSPALGDKWRAGQTFTIKWTSAPDASRHIRISLYKGGCFKQRIAGATDNDGLFNWKIPNGLPTGSDYQVVISAASSPGGGVRSDMFSILGGPPNGKHNDGDGGKKKSR